MTPTEPPTQSPIARRVLLVDDDRDVRDMMTVSLERGGFDVVATANVKDALRCIATDRFDAA